MPTGARLFGFLAFAALAFFTSGIFVPLLPEGTQTGLFPFLNAALGGLCGWMIMGPNTGNGYYRASGTGVRTSVTFVFYALIGWSVWLMLEKSTSPGTYGGAMEAINGAFGLMFDYFMLMISDNRLSVPLNGQDIPVPQIPIVLVVGGFFSGWLAEWASERFS